MKAGYRIINERGFPGANCLVVLNWSKLNELANVPLIYDPKLGKSSIEIGVWKIKYLK